MRAPRNPWVRDAVDTGDENVRIVCFPPAGGSPGSFSFLRSSLPDGIGLSLVCLPARESRIADPPAESFQDAVTQISAALSNDESKGRLVLLGVSLGGLLAFEVGKIIAQATPGRLINIVVASAASPDTFSSKELYEVDPEQLLRRIESPVIRSGNSELAGLAVAALTHDLNLLRSYKNDLGKVDCPISVLHGASDSIIDDRDLLAWSRCSSKQVSYEVFAGGHFFLDEYYAEQIPRWIKHIDSV